MQYSTKLFAAREQVDTQWEESDEMEPPPLRSEVELAMKQLKDGKSPGYDNLTSEMWKATGEEGTDLMWRLCSNIWNSREWPKDWCRAVFIPLPKKGDLKKCANHRTISLICHASKILLKVISRRMKIKLQAEISDEQAGFREGRRTREQIVNIRNILEKCREHKHPLYLCFIDYSKSFDCVSHSQLWNTMARMGFPSHIIELIKNLYHHQEATVRTSNGNTEWFGIGRGVRQGCILSPNLFNIYSEDIMRKALEGFKGGVKFGGKKIMNLRYADETTLVCSSREELMDLLNRIKLASEEKDLLLNTKKTKIMVVDRDYDNTEFTVAGNTIEVVNWFEYLGSIITNKGAREHHRDKTKDGNGKINNTEYVSHLEEPRPISQSEGSSASSNFFLYCYLRK